MSLGKSCPRLADASLEEIGRRKSRMISACMHMRMHLSSLPMTKVISLSKKPYGTLKKLKRQNESFSDLRT